MSIQAMSAHKYCTDCTECQATNEYGEPLYVKDEDGNPIPAPGRYRIYSRHTSRISTLKKKFGLAPFEARGFIRILPSVQDFYGYVNRHTGGGPIYSGTYPGSPAVYDAESESFLPEQIYPAPCCDKCESCRETFKKHRYRFVFRQMHYFTKMHRQLGNDVAMITLFAPPVAPRPEHYDDYYDVEAREAFREEYLDRRAQVLSSGIVESYTKYLAPSGIPDGGFLYEHEGYRQTVETRSFNVSRAGFFEDSPPDVSARVAYAKILSTEDAVAASASRLEEDLEDWQSAEGDWEPLPRHLRLRSEAVSRRQESLRVARESLFELARADVEADIYEFEDRQPGQLESVIEAEWQVHGWKAGWLQSTYGPGYKAPPGTPHFYIPRKEEKRGGRLGFTYEGTVRVKSTGERVVEPVVNRHWHRKYGDIVPEHITPFRMSSQLFNHLFNNLKKRLAIRGHRFSYIGAEEHGSSQVDLDDAASGAEVVNREEHYHLHLLIGLRNGSVPAFRDFIKSLWHGQSGNCYWGKKHQFCSILRDDKKSAGYVAKYLTKTGATGRLRKSHGLNLNRALLEESLISINPQFAGRTEEYEFADPERRRGPRYVNRLDEDEVSSCLHRVWAGIRFEERNIGYEPVLVARAESTPAQSIHKAGGVSVTFRTDELTDIIPLSYWVPASVWHEAQSNPQSPAAQSIQEALDSWAEHICDVVFPPD